MPVGCKECSDLNILHQEVSMYRNLPKLFTLFSLGYGIGRSHEGTHDSLRKCSNLVTHLLEEILGICVLSHSSDVTTDLSMNTYYNAVKKPVSPKFSKNYLVVPAGFEPATR